MNWELYEVWAEDQDGHQELVETTNSLKQARSLAYVSLELDDIDAVIICKEEGDEFIELERLTR